MGAGEGVVVEGRKEEEGKNQKQLDEGVSAQYCSLLGIFPCEALKISDS